MPDLNGLMGAVYDETNRALRISGGAGEPRHIEVDALMAEKSHVGFATFGQDGGRFRAQYRQSSGAVNDEVSWDLYIPAGTWSFTLYGYNGANRGIMTVQLDGVTAGTVDQYAAAGAATRGTIAGIVVAASGVKTVRLLMATKNASSTSFFGELAGFSFYRTA